MYFCAARPGCQSGSSLFLDVFYLQIYLAAIGCRARQAESEMMQEARVAWDIMLGKLTNGYKSKKVRAPFLFLNFFLCGPS